MGKRAWISPRRLMAETHRPDGTSVRLFKRRGYWKIWVSNKDGWGFAVVCGKWRGFNEAKFTYNYYARPGV